MNVLILKNLIWELEKKLIYKDNDTWEPVRKIVACDYNKGILDAIDIIKEELEKL